EPRMNAFIKSNQAAGDMARENASNYAWNQLIQELVVNKEYEKVGINISQEEASSLLYSEDAHALIKQYFTQEGKFSAANVVAFKKQAANNPQAMEGWELLVKQISLQVKSERYNSLVKSTFFATDLDFEDEFYSNN